MALRKETLELNTRNIASDVNINTLGPGSEGRWGKGSSVGTTFANGFPEEATVGVLDIYAGGNFGGMQVFYARGGGTYIRSLAASWNGVDGPWLEWRTIQGYTRPLTDAIDLNTLGGQAHIGLWRNALTTTASDALHYPVFASDGLGILEVLEGGGYSRIQRFTTNRGQIFTRTLALAWNGVDGPWDKWVLASSGSHPNYYSGDMNLLLQPGIWSITDGSTTTTNAPVGTYMTTSATSICEVILRSSNNSVLQRFTTIATALVNTNRTWQRTLSGTTWSEWSEVLNSTSIGLNYGIGQVSNTWVSTAVYDWQQMDFAKGVITHARFSQFTNMPTLTGVAPLPDARCYLEPLSAYSPVSTLRLIVHRGNSTCEVYHILVSGVKGSRVFTVRQMWTEGNTTKAADGTLKAASPIVKIFQDGAFETNSESFGATVTRLDVGKYLIQGCMGLNSDASWGGIDGGFDVPTDRNKQPLIWLDYQVRADGAIQINTYHRVHPNSPDFAQNRVGYLDDKNVFVETVKDKEPIDIPEYQFISVRVQMDNDNNSELVYDDPVELGFDAPEVLPIEPEVIEEDDLNDESSAVDTETKEPEE